MEVIVIALAIIRMFFSLLGLALSLFVKAVVLVFSLLRRLFRFLFGKGGDQATIDLSSEEERTDD